MTGDQPDVTVTRPVTTRPASQMPADEGRFAPGFMLAHRYRVVSLLGRGGMGEVYRVNDLMVGETVALKFLPETWAHDEAFISRFRNEVRVARMVSHPNVCRVHDLAEAEGRVFLSMQFVDGEDLSSLLRRIGRLPGDKAIEIARKLCAGLQAAHDKGIIHRDLKPANIMIDGRGEVIITDFGLAGLADSIRDVSSGTPAYMAPEQRAGQEVTTRSDIYSLGLVLYEVFTGKRREDSLTTDGTLSPDVRRLLDQCCDADPSQRPPSASAVARALPGGDPLAAAMAAGQTPSPEMVASAGDRTGLKPPVALALFAIPLIAGLFMGWAWDRMLPVSPLAPEELRIKARDLVQQTEGVPAANEIWGVYDSDGPESLDHHGLWIPQRFWYRVSPLPLGSLRTSSTTAIGPEDPPITRPGMILALFDMRGALIRYEAVRDFNAAKGPGPDWERWIALTGVEPKRMQLIESNGERAMWSYRDAEGSAYEIRGAAESGRVRRFEVHRVQEQMQTASPWPWRIEVILSVAALVLAIRNYRLGRTDFRGAAALALFVLCTSILTLLLRSHDLLHWSRRVTPVDGLGVAVLLAGMYGAAYLAMEPFVRRRWPTVLVTWTRLLHGEWRNPTVGRDVLIGFAATSVTQILIGSALLWFSIGNFSTFEPLQSTPFFLAGLVNSLSTAVTRGVTLTFLLFLVRLLVRKDWIAAVIVILLFTAMLAGNTGTKHPVALAMFCLIGTVQVGLIVKFGFLAKVAAEIPVLAFVLVETLDAGRWYGVYSYLAIAWVGLAAFAALRVATAGQRLLSVD